MIKDKIDIVKLNIQVENILNEGILFRYLNHNNLLYNPNTGQISPLVVLLNDSVVLKYQIFDTIAKEFSVLADLIIKDDLINRIFKITCVKPAKGNRGGIFKFEFNRDFALTIEDVIELNRRFKIYLTENINFDKRLNRMILPQRIIFEQMLNALFTRLNYPALSTLSENTPVLIINKFENSVTAFTKKFDCDLNDVLIANQHASHEILKMLQKLFLSLDELYKIGFIHRDIKPGNILYNSATNSLILADFGISIFGDNTLSQMQGKEILASLPYASPDLHSKGKSSLSTDMYSLIVTIWQILEKMDVPPAFYRFKERKFIQPDDFNTKDLPLNFRESPFKDNLTLYNFLRCLILYPTIYMPKSFKDLFCLINLFIDLQIDSRTSKDLFSLFSKRKLFVNKLKILKEDESYKSIDSIQAIEPDNFNYLTANIES